MDTLLPLVPVPAVLAFAVLAFSPVPLGQGRIRAIGVAGGAGSALLVAPFVVACLVGVCRVGPVPVVTGTRIGALDTQLAVLLDPVGLIAAGAVSGVGVLVLVYSVGYMGGLKTSALCRFFALMNLFIAAMLTLIMAGDAVVLFFGWELIGLCSFFLIAFDGRAQEAILGGRTAFVTTRIADAFLLTGLILLFLHAGTIDLEDMIRAATVEPTPDVHLATALIVTGALGKSAQLPFQTWLPKAMAGPTPVSALLHSATMVAAGVVLLARLSPLLAATPEVAWALALVGIATVLLGGCAALVQRDIKELLAYSSVSQLGYMMLALGAGAPGAAMAHFLMHASFKALLFLSAGLMSEAAGHSRDLYDLRGAARRSPALFWSFAVGAASLAGLPFVTAGGVSKEALLTAVRASDLGGAEAFWIAAIAAAVVTGAYALRPVFLTATGHATHIKRSAGRPMALMPLGVLAAASLGLGLTVEGVIRLIGDPVHGHAGAGFYAGLAAPCAGALLAVGLAWFGPRVEGGALGRLLGRGFGFEALYEARIAGPYRRLARRTAFDPISACMVGAGTAVFGNHDPRSEHSGLVRPEKDVTDRAGAALVARAGGYVRRLVPDRIDRAAEALGRAIRSAAAAVARLQTGRLRDYAMALSAGLVLLLILTWSAR